MRATRVVAGLHLLVDEGAAQLEAISLTQLVILLFLSRHGPQILNAERIVGQLLLMVAFPVATHSSRSRASLAGATSLWEASRWPRGSQCCSFGVSLLNQGRWLGAQLPLIFSSAFEKRLCFLRAVLLRDWCFPFNISIAHKNFCLVNLYILHI